jgi:hypothetical protein
MRDIRATKGVMEPSDHPLDELPVGLPAVLHYATPSPMTPLPDGLLIPSPIADAGDPASWRYIDFFTSNIRNPNTRRAYARACQTLFAWCDERGLALDTIRPYGIHR